MWKNEKRDKELSELKKTSDKIIAIINSKTKSQKEILKEILPYLEEGKNLHPNVLSNHLRRLVNKKKIAYIGTNYGKVYPKILLRKVYERKWPENAQRIYLRTPGSGKLYRKLIRKFKRHNNDLISEIVRYYQAIEVKTKFQEIYLTEIMKKDISNYYRLKGDIVKFDSNNSDFEEFVKIIKFTPLMHWCAYAKGSNLQDIIKPLFDNLRDLFVRINNLNFLIPSNRFDAFNLLKS